MSVALTCVAYAAEAVAYFWLSLGLTDAMIDRGWRGWRLQLARVVHGSCLLASGGFLALLVRTAAGGER